jgi:hypothetical protein
LQELTGTTYTHNATTVGVVVENKNIGLPIRFICVFSNNKNTCFTEIMFTINLEDYDDWLVNNKTWKKWTMIGDGESLSHAGIDFHKPIDEEQLVKEIKRRKQLNDMKLGSNRK